MDDRLTIICGDALEKLRELPDESVQCCVTSPPYWGLRDYGTAKWEGGDTQCDHSRPLLGGTKASTLNAKRDDNGWLDPEGKTQPNKQNYRDICGKCGAKRIDAQLGLEKTPEEYVSKLVEVVRGARRVLKEDGTLWVNLGDSYAGSGKGGNPEGSKWKGFVGNSKREAAAMLNVSVWSENRIGKRRERTHFGR